MSELDKKTAIEILKKYYPKKSEDELESMYDPDAETKNQDLFDLWDNAVKIEVLKRDTRDND